jgi:hypothetical protein
MNCSEYLDLLAARMEGLLDEAASERLERHLRTCEVCRSEATALAELHDRLSAMTGPNPARSLRGPVMERIQNERQLEERRLTMKGRLTRRFAIAASLAIVAATVAALLLLPGVTRTAYAIGDTIAAQRNVRTVHIKMEPVRKGSVSEAWAELDGAGGLLRLRMDFPDTDDGPKVVFWANDKADVWLKAKKIWLVVRAPEVVGQMPEFFLNPWGALERLQGKAREGGVTVETLKPTAEQPYIRVIVTPSDDPNILKTIYYVDPSTDLPARMEFVHLSKGSEETATNILFTDYDRPFGPEVFSPKVPTDVTRIDQTIREVGLAKGKMSDEEVAVALARRFLEAVLARDYAEAGRLFEGMPTEMAEKNLGQGAITGIVSIGKPVPADPKIGGFRVPVEIKAEQEGKTVTRKGTIAVRPVYNQPDHWTIHGMDL